jgi:hypothetical protein
MVSYIYINADQKFADCDFYEAKNIEKINIFVENQSQSHTIIYYTLHYTSFTELKKILLTQPLWLQGFLEFQFCKCLSEFVDIDNTASGSVRYLFTDLSGIAQS